MSTRSLGSITNSILQMNGLSKPIAELRKNNENTDREQYIYPILTNANFKETLANYNKHIKKYNMQVWMNNAEVRKYNKEVIKNRRANAVSFDQKVQEQVWKETHKHLEPEDYNKAVEAYNNEHGPQLRKRNIKQEVKPDTEKYFMAFLHQFNMQLFKRKEVRSKLGVDISGDLPKLELYPNKIVEAEKDGCKNLPVSTESVRHHRERLEQAGVLHSYEYRGSKRPVKIAFNEEILSLTDNKKPKTALTDNQAVTENRTNKVQHNNVSSRKNILVKYNTRDKGNDATAPLKSDCTKEFTKKPKGKLPQKIEPAKKIHGQNSKKLTISEVLAENLVEKGKLGQNLAAGEYKNYRSLGKEILKQEVFYGALNQDDFKEVIIQDIFKFSAKIFNDLNDIHPGAWVNAYNLWIKSKFISPNGYTLNKVNLFDRWQKHIAVLQEIRKFKENHPSWQPHYPSLYFDPARLYKENNSFEYAYRNFRLESTALESEKSRKLKALKDLRKKTDVKKAQLKIREYLSGKINLDAVYEYVKYNCNHEVNEKINILIKKEFNKVNQ
ncbi:hypothetical protein [Mesonia sp. HuA40]|uniref:hypothetical protein n=1 Tax=Mesonia sp. HuA40 TaxID=2602761 RepID=UPI0011CB6BCA|nr:hypothetical protein [Mesonia sp. HuA40]TXK73924.1 hypothetical protein FT993_03435 [Mesonia sp. HuA40]